MALPKIPPRNRPLIGRARICATEWYTYLESLARSVSASLVTEVAALSASITAEIAARVAGDTALATSITTLNASVSSLRTGGKALNADTNFYDISLWTARGGIVTFGLSGGATPLNCAKSAAGVPNSAITLTKGFTVDTTKWYKLTAQVQKGVGTDGQLYLRYSTKNPANDGLIADVDIGLTGVLASAIGASWTSFSATFQPSTNYIAPTINLNQGGTAGYMEIAELIIEEVTDIVTTQASVTTEATVRASSDSALASSITSEAATRSSTDTTIAASVATEASARASADGALSSNITSLTASYNSISASGAIAFIVAATAAGADASYEIQISGGSYTASFKMDAMSGGGSRIRLAASQISIDGTLLVNGAIIGSHLANGSTSVGLDRSGAGPVTVPSSGADATIDSFTFTNTSGGLVLTFNGTAALTSAGSVSVLFSIYQGGSLVQQVEMANLVYLSPQNIEGCHNVFGELQITTKIVDPPATGSNTWYFKASTPDGIDVDITNWSWVVTGWK